MVDVQEPKRARLEDEAEDMRADGSAPDAGTSTSGQSPRQALQRPRKAVQELMRAYYGSNFPYEEFCAWLAYGNDSKLPQTDPMFFQRRELCFTLDGDIFVRYQSFKDKEELQRAMANKVPAKIDIGPVYNVDPQRRKAYTGLAADRVFAPVERELVFDIDLTDYDDVRTCGKEGHICNACWPLMAVAVEIIDACLREDFGFQHILWVFSGRRGIHCWVCDERARKMTDEQRSAVASYLSVYRGSEGGSAKLALSQVSASNHPSVDRALRLLTAAWTESILPQQRLLAEEGGWEAILAVVRDEEVCERLRGRWRRDQGRLTGGDISCERWAELCAEIDKVLDSRSADRVRKQQLLRARKEVLFAFAYPRLDVEVSKKMNHLLKAPFCVHPKTGKVCIPMDPSSIWSFDPESVVTVQELVDEDRGSPKAEAAAQAMEAVLRTFRGCFLDELTAASKQSIIAKARSAAQAGLAW